MLSTRSVINPEFLKFIFISVVVGVVCALLGFTLKSVTEHAEALFAHHAGQHSYLRFLFPALGMILIFFFRKYLFRGKENKGIKEIFNDLKHRENGLPAYKIPSHYINGFLTVILGGSTGVEVSTVVAAATAGSLTHRKARVHYAFRKELINAGIAAGVTALFGSPVAGILFSIEVISGKFSRRSLAGMAVASATVWILDYLVHDQPLFAVKVDNWNLHALPYFVLLGIVAGLNSVYLTRCVLFFKHSFAGFSRPAVRITLSVAILGICLLLFPQLYGEGYAAMKVILSGQTASIALTYPLFVIAGIFLFKPIVTSATLAGGGDGGVFAPSMFIGAFLGLFLALFLNRYFHLHLIPLNFMIIGMAAVLSASLHAPYTALFLVCGLVDSYVLFVPVWIASLVAKYVARFVFPYTVYTYSPAAVFSNARKQVMRKMHTNL